MAQEKETKVAEGTPKWIWIVIALVVIVGGLAVWYFTRGDNNTKDTASTESTEETKTVAKHPDWSIFTAKKYGFTISHPKDYSVTETEVGNLIITKAGAEIADMYVVSAAGSDPETTMQSQESLFTDDARGIMVTDEVVQIKVADISAKMATGVFGKNGGINLSHEGVTGLAIFFVEDEKLFTFDSFDNGDLAARQIFRDIVEDIQF